MGGARSKLLEQSRRCALLASAVALLTGLVGCGESSSPSAAHTSSAPATAASSIVSSGGSAASATAVALVAGKPIAKSTYAHWLAVEDALGGGAGASHRALGFLITSAWLIDEAGARGVAVSGAQAQQRLAQLKQQNFPKAGAFQRYLANAHESEADLLERVKIELLESRIAEKVAPRSAGTQRKATLARFQHAFQARWKSRTSCRAGYVMEDCSEYHGKPESSSGTGVSTANAASGGASSSPASGASASAAKGSAASSSANTSGEVYTVPGSMTIASSAFERNAAIPAQYTCDGANISPPLEWRNVPAKAAALVLFVIDGTPTGPASGIRWVVGDIDPTAQGVAAGKTPAGGVVGSDTQGHSGYGGICPARGTTSTLEFVLYALRKKIPLTPGFAPATAEGEYGAGKDLLGSAAVTYAVYHRS